MVVRHVGKFQCGMAQHRVGCRTLAELLGLGRAHVDGVQPMEAFQSMDAL